MQLKKLGLIINPWAGVGGPAGLKGSDGADTLEYALAVGVEPQAQKRAALALRALQPFFDQFEILCFAADMGQTVAQKLGFRVSVVGSYAGEYSTAEDSERAARLIHRAGADLIIFVGGDGTARNMANAVGESLPLLGIPAGVKMHSACFAISPRAGGEILRRLMTAKLVHLQQREVRDIDEQAFRQGRVSTRYYGDLKVPEEGHFLQSVKNAGREVEALAVADIAAEVIEELEPDTLYIVGPGSTTLALLSELDCVGTLLGVDLLCNNRLLKHDVDTQQIRQAMQQHSGAVKIIVTAIGGQGHLFGRGNQQLSPDILTKVGRDNLLVVATKTKITELGGRPLLLDSGEPQLDENWSGFIPVITGYRDTILYPLSNGDIN
ncbi:MAG: ATP-NAD kinase family protein [Gammaproteobacteria bacterium]|nr:ATP-NAD kinase family protein [Gammaproteobacteria bacterium]